MKKYLFLALAAVATLTACQQGEEPQTVAKSVEIQFAAAAVETRAAVTAVTTEETLVNEGFAVWGFAGTTKIFNAAEVCSNTKQTTALDALNLASSKIADAFSPVNTSDVKYWSANTTYMFSAMYPISLKEKYNYDWNGTTSTQKITSFENDGLIDLIVAEPSQVITDKNLDQEGKLTTNAAADLHFNHMLSRIRFSFTNNFVDDNVTIEISNLKIDNTPASGNANIVYTPATASIEKSNLVTWTHESDKKLFFYDSNENETTTLVSVNSQSNTNDDIVGESVYRYIIPGINDYTISFDLVVKADGNIIASKSYTEVALPKNGLDNSTGSTNVTEFIAGKGYIFNANINVDQSGALYPIQFTVTVEDWGDDIDGGDIDLSGK